MFFRLTTTSLQKRFNNVLSADIDKYACEVYKHLYNEDSYNDVTSDEFKSKVENTEYDVFPLSVTTDSDIIAF